MRFGLRDLFWLTVTAAVWAASYHYHEKELTRLRKLDTFAQAIDLEELMRHVDQVGIENVHSFHFIYSRWYGTEARIGIVENKLPQIQYKVSPETKDVSEYPYMTKYGWHGSTMFP